MQTFSCGNTIEYELEDKGKSFRCQYCGHQHSFPNPSKGRKEKIKDKSSRVLEKIYNFQKTILQAINGFTLEKLVKSFLHRLRLLVHPPIISEKHQDIKKNHL